MCAVTCSDSPQHPLGFARPRIQEVHASCTEVVVAVVHVVVVPVMVTVVQGHSSPLTSPSMHLSPLASQPIVSRPGTP